MQRLRCLALRLATALLALLASGAVCAVTEIRTSAQEGTDPKFQNADGQGDAVVGLCIDIMRAVERLDPSLKFVGDQRWQPLTRIYYSLDRGMLDAACGLSHTRERDEKYRYIEPVLFSIHYHLIVRSDDTVQVNSWDDVRKLGADGVVLANRGFAGVSILEHTGGLQVDASAATPRLNLQKLQARRGRFFFHREPGLQNTLNRAGAGEKVRILPLRLASSPLYFVLAKQVHEDTIERLQTALLALEKNGELERIRKAWP